VTDSSGREHELIEPAELPTDFEAFFAAHKSTFLRTAGSRLRDPHDADEALMEAAVAMYRKWERILAHANPMALANRILSDAITDFYRRRARIADRERSCATPPTSSYLMELRSHDQLDRAMDELEKTAPIQASCVRLRYLVGLEYEDVAHRLGITPGAAKSNVHYGIKKLYALMDLPDTGKGNS
jgi:RNA polymerase sigma factor (sigma-70 family)